ncbi:MAG: hypothetical protein QXE01_01695 [Sulfolobales archaeon]
MAEHVTSIGLDVIASILTEYAKKIIDKAVRGEKLSDWEVGFLLMEATRRTLEARMDAIEKRMAGLEESLKTRMESLEKSLSERMNSIEKRMDMLEKRIGEVEKNLTMRIELLEKRVEGLETDMKQLRASMDSLRDLIINRLVEALVRRP